ncbi:hypothetical protein LQZ19_01560 [Treponema primitia]|uniref:radical SAM protein n=1 Tax=Treponema primitia TaxID=88058 RepID=UPI00397FB6F6
MPQNNTTKVVDQFNENVEGINDVKFLIEKYSDVSPFVILKTDVQRRGVHYTESALSQLDPEVHQTRNTSQIFGARDKNLQVGLIPSSLLLRDGTSICVDAASPDSNPYYVEYIDGKIVLTDKGEVFEEVEYWEKPAFFDKKTSSGKQMSKIVNARPQRLSLAPYGYCHFWDNGNGCRYCDVFTQTKARKSAEKDNFSIKTDPRDISETYKEALKEEGRYTTTCLTSGSQTHGAEPFDDEVDYYIEVIQAIGENFTTKKFPIQLIGTAYNEKQLRRLYEETGLSGYTSDIEVLDPELFKWICPGKSEWIGFNNWKQRLYTAVDIFGRGNVNSGIVGGVELAQPNGFKNEDEALKHTLEGVEELAQHGVTVVNTVWIPRQGSYFEHLKIPSLDYYVRLAKGIYDITEKYDLTNDTDDFRRCGNHPNSDLLRLHK